MEEQIKKLQEELELAKKQDFIAYENWQECEKELEELKRDVKRYFKLVEKTVSYVILGREDECYEVERLKDKLLEVGGRK